MNRSSFALLSSVIVAAASVPIAAFASLSLEAVTTTPEQRPENEIHLEPLAQQQQAQSQTPQDTSVEALPLVINTVLSDASKRVGIPISELNVVEAKQQNWPDSCLGLGTSGAVCDRGLIPGWNLTVASGSKRWVYRTNQSGTLVKLDEAASQPVVAQQTPPPRTQQPRSQQPLPLRQVQIPELARTPQQPPKPQPATPAVSRTPQQTPKPQPTTPAVSRTPQQTPKPQPTTPTVSRTPQQAPQPQPTTPAVSQRPTPTPTPRQTPAVNQRLTPTPTQRQTPTQSQGNFSLAIRQPSGKSSDVVARVALTAKGNNAGSAEKFVGDFKYQINNRAVFVGGMKAGDRVVVRLYDSHNRAIGFSEFEVLPDNAAVNVVVSEQPEQTRLVRTVYGLDANKDGAIDNGASVYDYFTQIAGSTPGQESVTFLSDLNNINVSQFQVAGLPAPTQRSVYPSSFNMANQTTQVFKQGTPGVLTATPATVTRLINVGANNTSTYNVSQLINQASPIAKAPTVQVSFNDVPNNHWAKNFIGNLAQKEIIKGYQGRFRPNDSVTRGELAAMLSLAFPKAKIREAVNFKDVTPDQWVHSYIQDAYQRGFFELEPGNVVNPNKKVSRLDVLVALARGLNYSPNGASDNVLQAYTDASAIPQDARNFVAAATERKLVVNYPNIKLLKPNQIATRAQVAALIYQGMVSAGNAPSISSPYIVQNRTNANNAGR